MPTEPLSLKTPDQGNHRSGVFRVSQMKKGGQVLLAVESLDDLVTTSEAAAAIGASCATIRSWAKRGHLQKSGLDERNHPMYRMIDVLRVARDTRWRAIGQGRTA